MKTLPITTSITKFSQFFELAGKNEQDYMVPENGTWDEKAAAQLRRLKLAQRVVNGGVKIVKADTSQWKYTPYFRVIKDETALAGFRLSSYAFGFVHGYTNLGARPEFLSSGDAVWFGETFTEECQLLAQYQAMAEEEDEV